MTTFCFKIALRPLLQVRFNYVQQKILLKIVLLETPSLEDLLMNHLHSIVFEEKGSAFSIKHGIDALKICLPSIIQTNDPINLFSLKLIDEIINVKPNPYWLIKV